MRQAPKAVRVHALIVIGLRFQSATFRDLRPFRVAGILDQSRPARVLNRAVIMIRFAVLSAAVFSLAACGGGNRFQGGNQVAFASGPIQQACQSAGRKNASRARCGCIQAVADWTLSPQDQRRGAGFFSNPQALQDVRQSDIASNERFWDAWKAYGQQAAEFCAET